MTQVRAAIIGPRQRAIPIACAFAPTIPVAIHEELTAAALTELAQMEINLYIIAVPAGEVARVIQAAVHANAQRPVVFMVTAECDPAELRELDTLDGPRVTILFWRELQHPMAPGGPAPRRFTVGPVNAVDIVYGRRISDSHGVEARGELHRLIGGGLSWMTGTPREGNVRGSTFEVVLEDDGFAHATLAITPNHAVETFSLAVHGEYVGFWFEPRGSGEEERLWTYAKSKSKRSLPSSPHETRFGAPSLRPVPAPGTTIAHLRSLLVRQAVDVLQEMERPPRHAARHMPRRPGPQPGYLGRYVSAAAAVTLDQEMVTAGVVAKWWELIREGRISRAREE